MADDLLTATESSDYNAASIEVLFNGCAAA